LHNKLLINVAAQKLKYFIIDMNKVDKNMHFYVNRNTT